MPHISPLELIQHKDAKDKNTIRQDEQEKQYRYYSGDAFNIQVLLKKALEITYDVEDIEEMQLEWFNITEKIINQMSVVYLEPAARKIMIKDDENEELTKYYLGILPVDINTADKQSHRLAKLHNTALTHITFEKGRFKYTTLPSYLYNVEHEDKNIFEVSYEKYFGDEWFQVFWTDKEHYRSDAFGNVTNLPDGDGVNPFGVVPFPVLRLKHAIDFWGEGQSDVINVNEQINVLLTKLVNSDVIMGTEGTILAVNLGMATKGEEKQGEKRVRIGRRHPISVDNVRSDDAVPSLQHITSEPHIEDTQQFIDWYIGKIAVFNGLKAGAILSDIKDTSDFQKIMDAVDQMEIRKDDIEPCRIFEQDRFEVTKIMNNVLVGTEQGEGLQKIPDEATLVVDFAEIEIQQTPKDKRDDRDWRLKNNLTTLTEIIMEDNPDLNKEAAEKLLEENKTSNSSLTGKLGRFEQLTQEEGIT